jgi:hypothetical protein
MREAEIIDLAERRERARARGPGTFARIALGVAVLVVSVCLLFGKIP